MDIHEAIEIICKDYCKYPDIESGNKLADICDKCPMNKCEDLRWADRKTENCSEKKKKDYQKVLDSYGIQYRKGTSEEVDASLRNMDIIFENMFCDTDCFFRNPTAEEMESVNKYIESISIPTGVNIFDLM